jgi:NAD(P)-dependent dehydrogenase (short-subunit alcohol dehydrogenase family)
VGQLDEKVVLLTGGASDIGRATAVLLSQQGARVAIGDVDFERAEEVARQVTEVGGEAVAAPCDVRSEESVRSFVELASRTFGGIDCLDHNAAWSHPRLDTDAGNIDLGVWEASSRHQHCCHQATKLATTRLRICGRSWMTKAFHATNTSCMAFLGVHRSEGTAQGPCLSFPQM